MRIESIDPAGTQIYPDGALRLFDRATDPSDHSVVVIGWPGCRPVVPPAASDLVLQRTLAGDWRIADPSIPGTGADEPNQNDPSADHRMLGSTQLIAPDRMVVRLADWGDPELLPPSPSPSPSPAPRPTIRQGSRGPSVILAQQRLNAVHAARLLRAETPLSSWPLDVDGIFGAKTRAATVSFQHVAFPNAPADWDGVIGPRSWAALDRHALEVPVPPIPPLPVPPRPTPVIHAALDPSRWGPILSSRLSPRSVLRSGNAVRSIVDGLETFRMMVADIRATRGDGDYVYLLGWDNFDDFELVPGDRATTFRSLFTAADGRGVEVAAMLWDQPFLNWSAHRSATAIVARINALRHGKAIEDDLTTNNTLASRARLLAALAAARLSALLIPVIVAMIEPDLARLGGSHHQKVLVVKRGSTLIGYCGGIDMNPNRIRVDKPRTGQPHHDTHCRVVGPSARDLLDTFLSRWDHHPLSAKKTPLRGRAEPVPRPVTAPSRADSFDGATASVVIARTFNPTRKRPPLVVPERDIKPLLLAAIGAARRFIYCEDQYLIDLDTADAIRAVLPHLDHVTIVIPGNPISDLPFAKEYRRDFVERAIRGLPATTATKLGVFQLSTSGRPPPVHGDHTYVHSKSWVFDDELAVIGTANCNRRGYTFDSEIDAFIFDDAATPTVFTAAVGSNRPRPEEALPFGLTFAQNYRIDLWQHHLGVSRSSLVDGVASGALWRRASRPAAARVVEYDHRLPIGTSRRAILEQRIMDIAADKLRDLIDPVP